MQENLQRIEREEKEKRYEHEEIIRKRMEQIDKLNQSNTEKI